MIRGNNDKNKDNPGRVDVDLNETTSSLKDIADKIKESADVSIQSFKDLTDTIGSTIASELGKSTLVLMGFNLIKSFGSDLMSNMFGEKKRIANEMKIQEARAKKEDENANETKGLLGKIHERITGIIKGWHKDKIHDIEVERENKVLQNKQTDLSERQAIALEKISENTDEDEKKSPLALILAGLKKPLMVLAAILAAPIKLALSVGAFIKMLAFAPFKLAGFIVGGLTKALLVAGKVILTKFILLPALIVAGIVGFIKTFVEGIIAIGDTIKKIQAGEDVWDSILDGFAQFFSRMGSWFLSLIPGVEISPEQIREFFAPLRDFLDKAKNFFVNLFSGMSFTEITSSIWDYIKNDFLGDVKNFVIGAFKWIVDKMDLDTTAFSDAFKTIKDAILRAIQSLVRSVLGDSALGDWAVKKIGVENEDERSDREKRDRRRELLEDLDIDRELLPRSKTNNDRAMRDRFGKAWDDDFLDKLSHFSDEDLESIASANISDSYKRAIRRELENRQSVVPLDNGTKRSQFASQAHSDLEKMERNRSRSDAAYLQQAISQVNSQMTITHSGKPKPLPSSRPALAGGL
jgi:hypothetical protein